MSERNLVAATFVAILILGFVVFDFYADRRNTPNSQSAVIARLEAGQFADANELQRVAREEGKQQLLRLLKGQSRQLELLEGLRNGDAAGGKLDTVAQKPELLLAPAASAHHAEKHSEFVPADRISAHHATMNYISSLNNGYTPDQSRINSPLPGTSGSWWWIDPKIPEAFRVTKLDMTYDASYFTAGHGHPSPTAWDPYAKYVTRFGGMVLGKEVSSIIELGNGGGYYADLFLKGGYDIITVEGTIAGYQKTLSRGFPVSRAIKHDLRLPLFAGRTFDVAVCTEVVEHVEPPFSSQIILNLVTHAQVIWFSFAPVLPGKGAWINHPNEKPWVFWESLFEFYGYQVIQVPTELLKAVNLRGMLIAYNASNPALKAVTTAELLATSDPSDRHPCPNREYCNKEMIT